MMTEGKTMHQLWEAVKHIIDAVMATVAGITLVQVVTVATSLMTFVGASLSVWWYIIRIREYYKTKKLGE
jgi:hypothetical protein